MQIIDFIYSLPGLVWGSVWPQWSFSLVGFLLIYVLFRGFFIKRRVQSKTFTRKQFGYEVIFSILTLTFGNLIGNAIDYLISIGWASVSEAPVDGALFAQILFQFAVYFVLFDAYFYFLHRLMHSDYFYWIHKHHHRSITPNPLTAFSFHPLEALMTGGFVVIMVVLFDLHLYSIIAVNAYGVINSVIVHCGHEVYPSWWYKNKYSKYYISTTYHDVHHSTYNYNFGAFTTFWDRLFGTMHPSFDNGELKMDNG
jgi:lathosterol oxidase